MTLTPGSRLAAYEVISPLGSGGMGEVYLGRDTRLGREVAIKILPSEFSSHEERLRRFEQEARSASALNHPNIITIYEIGVADSSSFIAMEYVDGKTLRELLHAGPLQVRRAVQIAVQLSEGLSKAHEAGIVHRDLKPENVMITREGYAKILDFGLAKLVVPASGEQISVLPTTARTDAGIVLGTVGYMSPEQASGGDIDFRSDQFAIGTIFYEMVTGKRAFQKKTSVETLSAIINEEPEQVQTINPRVPAPVRWIIERCLEKNPEDRYASTRDLARDLQSIRDHFSEIASSAETGAQPVVPPKRKSPRLWDILSAAMIVVLALTAIYLWKRPAVQQVKPFTSHRLTYQRGPINSARYTSDGSSIVYSARWEGKPRELFVTRPDALESRSLGVNGADVLSISGSGEMLVLMIKEDDRNVLGQVSLSGGVPRELANDVRTADWSPDGNNIAIAKVVNAKVRVEYPAGKAIYESSKDIHMLRFSRSGDRIAFNEHTSDASNGKIVVIDRNGKKITESKQLYPLGLAWHSSDDIWFSTISEKPGGGCELYSMDMNGRLRYIAPFAWGGIYDISTKGDMLLRANHRTSVALVFTDGGTKENNVTWLDQSEIVDISPDGKKVLIHERGEASESPSGTIYMANSDGSGGVRLAAGAPLEFSPDGKSVVGTFAQGMEIVPVGAGTVQHFSHHADDVEELIGFLPDAKRILLWVQDPKGNIRLDILTPSTSKRETISHKELFPLIGKSHVISPDGQRVIMRTADFQYVLLSLKDQSVQLLKNLEAGEEPLEWTKDGHAIYVYSTRRIPCKIYKLEITTGNRQEFKEIIPPDPVGISEISTFRVSSDERIYAYTYQRILSALFQIRGLQ